MNNQIIIRLPNSLNDTLKPNQIEQALGHILVGLGALVGADSVLTEVIVRDKTNEVYARLNFVNINITPEDSEWALFTDEMRSVIETAIYITLTGYIVENGIGNNDALQDRLEAMPFDQFMKEMTKQ